MVKINGEALAVAGKTLAEYLAGTDYNPKRIAVERNGEIVPKAAYGETILQDGDVIEVVNFVGGYICHFCNYINRYKSSNQRN